jgi:hypothetical protein
MSSAITRKSFEVILKMPDLKNRIKLDVRISKRGLLFLARIIDVSLAAEEKKEEDLLALLSDETKTELKAIRDEMLKRSELEEFYAEILKLG